MVRVVGSTVPEPINLIYVYGSLLGCSRRSSNPALPRPPQSRSDRWGVRPFPSRAQSDWWVGSLPPDLPSFSARAPNSHAQTGMCERPPPPKPSYQGCDLDTHKENIENDYNNRKYACGDLTLSFPTWWLILQHEA